jgi:Icc-related predicted phosphoesterase
VLCGHVHQSPPRPGGSWVDRIGSTLVFNPGRQYGRPPTHIILDSAHQTGLWFSEAISTCVLIRRRSAPKT